ncbi:MAG: dihydrofolate reductase family protein [Chloroflexota bacterium]|nr:dihydrofolate reductase family protein [Chloroflexota bacterium]
MGRVIAGMTMSLDGFVADIDGDVSQLYPDFAEFAASPSMAATIAATGAVVMGRRTFEMADPDAYVGQYEFQVPIFVVTTRPSARQPMQDAHLTFTFVAEGVAAAIAQARDAAGERDVQIVGGPNVIKQALQAGLVDDLHVDVMPVLLGGGLQLFGDSGLAQVQLSLKEIARQGQRTGLRFSVLC